MKSAATRKVEIASVKPSSQGHSPHGIQMRIAHQETFLPFHGLGDGSIHVEDEYRLFAIDAQDRLHVRLDVLDVGCWEWYVWIFAH